VSLRFIITFLFFKQFNSKAILFSSVLWDRFGFDLVCLGIESNLPKTSSLLLTLGLGCHKKMCKNFIFRGSDLCL
jgi:hypothetical protein